MEWCECMEKIIGSILRKGDIKIKDRTAQHTKGKGKQEMASERQVDKHTVMAEIKNGRGERFL